MHVKEKYAERFEILVKLTLFEEEGKKDLKVDYLTLDRSSYY